MPWRAVYGDFNAVINSGTAVRLAVMGERSNVADRDVVLNQRFGFAPSISFGMDGPTRLNLSYLHQEENNIPDYGIPFLWGRRRRYLEATIMDWPTMTAPKPRPMWSPPALSINLILKPS